MRNEPHQRRIFKTIDAVRSSPHPTPKIKTNSIHMNNNVNPQNQKHIFLLSHMRANSSLIGHILGSHPQIKGYFEMHTSYRSAMDMITQEQILEQSKELSNTTKPNSIRYVFDKLLHNSYELLLENLRYDSDPNYIKILVSLRQPQQSIKSIISLFKKKHGTHPYAEPEKALEYYRQRINALAQFCDKNKQSYYYYDAELIRNDTQNSLPRLQNWLNLETPLKEEYQLFSLTGKAWVGDSSENMTKGKIIKHENNYSDIELPEHLLQTVIDETEQCRKLIIAHAIDSMNI
ncbi:hypothetical protein [sulfur-oxidizing endosymbiont of Gigantopelta aegis]|uniref:hypothetical protein n=1 Tax=sulfur-oxidizing endosymbiont of Gigantopelta aegis TaxID=2794934 RepID=UPI0018DD16BF|nr:hypothetical protein [sulfur-oxidizing endosymbiont of Gigantopelta aegis]